jgi:putative flavoprotein involved in K+ transport
VIRVAPDSSGAISPSTETAIIGAGQAGLAMSRCLTDLDRDHVVLERGRVAERWRSERWDSFRLLTPNWHTRLPGHRYAGPDPDGFMDRRSVTTMFECYARSFRAPVEEHTTVVRVTAAGNGWCVATDRGEFRARNVIVATGPHDRPRIPASAARFGSEVEQVHAGSYRRPDRLRPGGVLVVGAGPTGQQLARELVRSGRRVYLAVGRHQRLPRTYRGRDAFWWLDRIGTLDETVDEQPGGVAPRPLIHPVLSASGELGLDRLVDEGVTPLGRLRDVDHGLVTFADDLIDRYLEAERAARRFTTAVDDHVLRRGMDVDARTPLPPLTVPTWGRDAPSTLDLRRADVTTVLWATGYRRD